MLSKRVCPSKHNNEWSFRQLHIICYMLHAKPKALISGNFYKMIDTAFLWQTSWPASLSPASLTLWLNWSDHWLTTLRVLSTQVRIPVGLSVPGRYSGCSSSGLGKAQWIDFSFRADWLWCFWWPVANDGLPGRGFWCHWEEGGNVTIQPAC